MNKMKSLLLWAMLIASAHAVGATITVEPLQLKAGGSGNIVVNLTNTETNLTSFQMSLYLPDGVTVQTDDGNCLITESARLNNGHSLSISPTSNGSYLVICFSTQKKTITGTSGQLLSIPVSAAASASGTMQACLKEITFSDVAKTRFDLSDVLFDITIEGAQTDDDDIDLSQYTLVKQFDLDGYGTTYFTIDLDDQRSTAWETGNKLQQKIYNVTAPAEFSDYLAFQSVYTDSGKGWYINESIGGLYSTSATRSAAVLNRKAGDLVVFESDGYDITTAMTLYNANGEPDGPFTCSQSTDGTKYYVSVAGDGQVGFCGNKNGSPITRISIYEPKVRPISVKADDLTINYGDALPDLTWTATCDGQTVAISGEPELTTIATSDFKPGSYSIVCRQGTVTTNGVLFANGTLTIEKGFVTVTAPSFTIKRGDPIPDLTPTYEGFVNGWTADQLPYQAVCTTEATSDSPAGTYTITFNQNPNSGGYYNFDLVEGTLTIVEQSQPEQPTIEVTDISQMDNAIYIEPFTARAGDDVQIEVKLKNSQYIAAYSFDLVLPEGVTLAKNAEGKFVYTLDEDRHDEHSGTINENDGNVYSVAVLSVSGGEMYGYDGAVITLSMAMGESMEEGAYPIVINNARYSLPNGQLVEVGSTTSALKIENVITGDVNGNGIVDIGDAVCIINHIVGKPNAVFVERAADVNGNGTYGEIGDAVSVVNIIVGKTTVQSARELRSNILDPQ